MLEDVADGVQGDQIAGCSAAAGTPGDGRAGGLHAPVFGDGALGAAAWLNAPSPLNQALVTQLLPGLPRALRASVCPPSTWSSAERFVESIDGWGADARPPLGLVHGDYRLDNMLFGAGCARVR